VLHNSASVANLHVAGYNETYLGVHVKCPFCSLC